MSFFPRIRHFVLGTVGVAGAGLLAATALAPAASAATPVSGALVQQWAATSPYYLGGEVAVSPNGNTGYFLTPNGGIGSINITTHTVSNISFNIPSNIGSFTDVYTNYGQTIALSPDATVGFVQAGATVAGQPHQVLLKVSLTTGAILNSLDLGLSQLSTSSPVSNADGTTVYAAVPFAGSAGNNSLLVAVNTSSFKITTAKTFTGTDSQADNTFVTSLFQIAVGNNGVYAESIDYGATDTTGKLLSFNPTTLAQTAAVNLGLNVGAITAQGTNVYVGGYFAAGLKVYASSPAGALSLSKTITSVNIVASGLAVSADASKIYINGGNAIEAVSLATGKVLSTVSVPDSDYYSGNITLSPEGTELYAVTASGQFISYTTNGSWLTAGAPSIHGIVAVGNKLTAATGTWTPGSSFAYQWYANGQAITGAHYSVFTPTTAQFGKTLSVRIDATKPGYVPGARVSAGTVVGAGTLKPQTPKIAGTLTTGKTVTVSPGSWAPGTSFSYQWNVGGKKVTGTAGTAKTLTLQPGWKGRTISVTVTTKQIGYRWSTTTSATSTIG